MNNTEEMEQQYIELFKSHPDYVGVFYKGTPTYGVLKTITDVGHSGEGVKVWLTDSVLTTVASLNVDKEDSEYIKIDNKTYVIELVEKKGYLLYIHVHIA